MPDPDAPLTSSFVGDAPADTSALAEIEGVWAGALETRGLSLRLALEISIRPDGSLSGTLISIDQGGKRLPGDTVKFENRNFLLAIAAAQVQYDGLLNADGTTLTGTWTQFGSPLPLMFHRAANVQVVRRPQDPTKPYPYLEEEVSYENTAASVRLGGTLTVPNGKGTFPALLLITGSGQHDRDEAILGHRPFLVLADYLTRRGVAVLRVDDRGIGSSTGDFASSTTADFAGDAAAGVRFLKTRQDVQARNIGLLGHSEGGLIAPMVAAESPDVAFIVMLAGPGLKGEDILLEQGALIARACGAAEEEIALDQDMKTRMFAVLREESDPLKAQSRVLSIGKEAISRLPQAQQAAGMQALEGQVKGLTGPWMRYFLDADPAAALSRVNCPVLALNGELDLQVAPDQNLAAIEAPLRSGGNEDFTLRKLSRLNHLFQTATTGLPSEYAQIDETINPVVLELIGDWIAAHAR